MTAKEKYWEDKFYKLQRSYKDLEESYMKLKEAYNSALDRNRSQSHHINQLRSDIKLLNSQVAQLKHFQRDSSPSKYSEFAKILHCKSPHVIKNITFLSPKRVNLFSTEETSCPLLEKTSGSSGKTPQANPDLSIELESNDPRMFEAIFVVGPSSSKSNAELLYEYPYSNSVSESVKRTIPEFCFPRGTSVRALKQTGSASDLNNILYGQVSEKRSQNWFVFTLKSEEEEEWVEDLPNCRKEVMYCVCLAVEDLVQNNNQELEWVSQKCYCLISYIPAFEIHYEVLSNLLLLKRLHRMENLVNTDLLPCSYESSHHEVELLKAYYSCEGVFPGASLEVAIDKIDKIKYTCPEDLSLIDIPYLTVPLFSSIRLNDLLFLLSAHVQEKSIVFVSENLGLVTSCVLALPALIRPFKWPNLIIPVIPNTLNELLDAPVPMVAGLADPLLKEPKNNLIWVILDEENPIRRVQGPMNLVQEVEDFTTPELLARLIPLYNSFPTCTLNPTPQQKLACCEIAKCLKEVWSQLLPGKTPQLEVSESFLDALHQTQMYNNCTD
mgnify:CR=1 FL=1